MLLVELADYSEFLPILLFIIFKRIRIYPYLFAGLVIQSAIEQYTLVLAETKTYNLHWYHLIGLIELIYVYLFYRNIIKLNSWIRNSIYFIIALYIFNSYYLEHFLLHFNAFGRALASFYLLGLGFYYLYTIYEKEQILRIHRSPAFIINSGLMFYFATSFFIFLFSRKIMSFEYYSWFGSAWVLHTLSDIIRSIVIAFALVYGDFSSSKKIFLLK